MTSDEVWARGCPPRNDRVLVMCSKPAWPAYEETIAGTGHVPFMRPDGCDPTSQLRAIENAGLVLVDALAISNDVLLLVGYAFARGKTVIVTCGQPEGLLDTFAAQMDDLTQLECVLQGMRPGLRNKGDRDE